MTDEPMGAVDEDTRDEEEEVALLSRMEGGNQGVLRGLVGGYHQEDSQGKGPAQEHYPPVQLTRLLRHCFHLVTNQEEQLIAVRSE